MGVWEQHRDPEIRLRLLAQTTRAFAEASLDIERLLQTIARGAAEVLGCFILCAVVSEDRTLLVPVATFDPDPDALALLQQLLQNNPSRLLPGQPATHVIETGEACHIPVMDPVAMLHRFRPEDHARVKELQIASALLTPLRAEGRSIGILTAVRHGKGARAFEDQDKELAQTLADHAALAISNAHLHERSKKLTARARLVADVGRDFAASTSDHDGLPELVARRFGSAVGGNCFVQVHDERAGLLPIRGMHCQDECQLPAMRRVAEAPPLRVGESASGEAFRSQKPLLVPVVGEEFVARLPPERRAFVEQLGIRSLIVIPLLAQNQVFGVATVSRAEADHPYLPEDLALLEDLSIHAALALSNSRLLHAVRQELDQRSRTEAALRRTEDQLRSAQKMEAIGRLAGGIAHDFNNLLSVVLGYSAQLLEEAAPDAIERSDIEEIHRAGQRAAELTRQLLAFSRRQVIEPRILNLNEMLGRTETMIRRLLGEDIELKFALGSDLDTIKADPGQIDQVIMNLVVNARDAMPRGGQLTIETANAELDEAYASEHVGVEPGRFVMLSVSDTGTGMDKTTMDRIFEPFFTTKEPGKGTGLGLSTLFGIMKQNQGSVWVYSEVGCGTTLKLYFPAQNQQASRPLLSDTTPLPQGTETVLLVEDDPQVRAVARSILTRAGYRVHEADSGKQASLVSEQVEGPIELLLTDIVMPGINGTELARNLARQRPAMRVLFMSGYPDDAIVHHGVVEAGVWLLQKPLTPERLLRKIREVLS